MTRIFFAVLFLLIVAGLAGVAYGLGGHSDGARLSAGVIAAVVLILGVGVVGRLRG